MSFSTTIITKCNECGQEWDDNGYLNHDCRSEEQKAADKAWKDNYDKTSKYWRKQEDRLGIQNAIMSVYQVKARDRAVEGKCVLLNRDGEEPYISRVLNNPTWATVLKHFDKSIPVTGDYHHNFLEGIGEYENGHLYRELPEDCRVFVFHTGS